jgi:hypothetical protein
MTGRKPGGVVRAGCRLRLPAEAAARDAARWWWPGCSTGHRRAATLTDLSVLPCPASASKGQGACDCSPERDGESPALAELSDYLAFVAVFTIGLQIVRAESRHPVPVPSLEDSAQATA